MIKLVKVPPNAGCVLRVRWFSHETQRSVMTTIEAMATAIKRAEPETAFDEAELAAAAFLARYGGRTLDA